MNTTETFFEEWFAHAGLLNQAEAARLLNCSSAYIDQLCREKKLEKIKVNGKKYLSFQEVYKYYKKKNNGVSPST